MRGSQPRFNCGNKEETGGRSKVSNLHPRRLSIVSQSNTYVVETGTDCDSESDGGANGASDGTRVFGLDSDVGVGDTSGEEGSVGGVNERGRGTVEFGKEDEEEGEGSGFGKVGVGTNGTLKLGNVGGAVGLLLTRTLDRVRFARAKQDVGVESVDDDVAGKVAVVAGEESRVRQRGLILEEGRRDQRRGSVRPSSWRCTGKREVTYRAENKERHGYGV